MKDMNQVPKQTTQLAQPQPAASNSWAQSGPTLPLELAELVGILLIRLDAAATLWADRSAITSPLNLLPRSAAPGLTQAALINLPHVDMNSASLAGHVDLLDFMYAWSTRAGGKGRPIQYSCNAPNPSSTWPEPLNVPLSVMDQVSGRPGLTRVLDWWWSKSKVLVVNWTEAAVDAAAANGDLETLDWWWNTTGSLNGGQEQWFKYSQRAVDNASGNGHTPVLAWFVKQIGSHLGEAAIKYSDIAMAQAAANGHVHVLRWWVEESGLQTKAQAVLDAAASTNQMDVLEWCLIQPRVLEQVKIGGNIAKYDTLVTSAIRQGNRKLLSWFEERLPSHVRASWHKNPSESMAAAETGDLFAFQWLQDRGWLFGTRQELISFAAGSGKLDVIEWVHKNVPSNNHQTIGWTSDEFTEATRNGDVEMMDWLVSHGHVPWPSVCYYLAASYCGKASVMDWWSNYEGEFERYDLVSHAFKVAISKRRFEILDWWLKADSEHMSPDYLDEYWELLEDAGTQGDVEMIRWWCEVAGADFAFLLRDAVVAASAAGHISVLEYYAGYQGFELDLDHIAIAIAKASDAGHITCLDWWFKHVHAGGSGDGAVFVQAFNHSFQHGPGGKSLLWWTQVFRIQDYGLVPECPYHRFRVRADLVQLIGSLDSVYSLFFTIRCGTWPRLTACDTDDTDPQLWITSPEAYRDSRPPKFTTPLSMPRPAGLPRAAICPL
ncbi:hypothetical protein BCR44DRAFT_1483662 [Catenaria anguillulae PL171]|uniref:Ankyrin repeat-containing domain protein n=1 Tax=Catenaria anguillulae PL171 TaxID=765915 RepID=A0A1Y2HTT7_9FUNG|nr:hypothetical protein BCR44DRAFT_1483662 [Catenaria anguillulae PL171]